MNTKVSQKILAFILFLGSVLWLQSWQEQQRIVLSEKHKAEVRLTLVDVIVTKDGQFLKDLTVDDFELMVDGKRRPINSFELVSFDKKDLRLPEGDPPPFATKRLVVVFDAINTWKKEIKEGGDQILDELVSLVKLGHEVMVVQLTQKKGVDILQPFTTDAGLIQDAVVSASGNVWRLKNIINPAYIRQLESDVTELEIEAETRAAMEDYLYGTTYEDMQRIEFLHRERQRFEKTLGGLLASFNMLRSIPGRKSVLVISAGIPDLSPPDMLPNIHTGIFSDQRTEDAYRSKVFGNMENLKVFDPFDILGDKTFKNGAEVLQELIRYANAHNISVYTLDSSIFVKHLYSGASAEHYQQNEMAQFNYREGDKIRKVQNLRWMSEDTGGDSLRGAKKFDAFRQVIDRDLTYHYQLSFYPRGEKADNEYHKIKVKVKRGGVDVRSRKGYTDYTKREANKMLLVTAFYNPSLYKELPFKAELVPFVAESGNYEPWMNIALPAKELLRDKFVEYAPKIFSLHVWIKDREYGEKGYGGTINIALNLSPEFMEFIKNIDYLSYHFKGPEFNFDQRHYQNVFALLDPYTAEVGTWESQVTFPDLKKEKEPALINCVLGDVVENSQQEKERFVLSKKDGSLVYGGIKFFPKVTNQFKQWEKASVFMQVYLPGGKAEIRPEFVLQGEDERLNPLAENLVAGTWNPKSRVWSGIYSLELLSGLLGKNTLYVDVPVTSSGSVINKELRLDLIR